MELMNLFFSLLVTVFFSFFISPSGIKASEDLIADPALSTKCKEALKDRANKIKMKQKSVFLIKKSEKMLRITPEHKKSIREKVQRVKFQAEQEKRILEEKINLVNEEIIRQGCPGISL